MSKKAYDAVNWYMNELGARVVAKTGIPSDRFHTGKLIFHCLRDDPDFLMQIDGATGESETNGSALDRTIRCAIALKNLGLKTGDVMVLMAPNHIHLTIPHNAATFLGIMIAPVDATLGAVELNHMFENTRPNIIFCQSEKIETIEKTLESIRVNAKIVTFDEGSSYPTLAQFLENVDEDAVRNFVPTCFDPEETVLYLIPTSGTTGFPKTAMLTHKNLAISSPVLWLGFTRFPTPTKMCIMVSPIQWLSACYQYLFSPILKYLRLQSSAPMTLEHFTELVNKYKPTYMACNPTMMTLLTTIGDNCDFSSFEFILLAGSAIQKELLQEVKKLSKTCQIRGGYGCSEMSGLAFHDEYPLPLGALGKPLSFYDYRLVHIESKQDVTEPYVHGELWIRGPTVFKGYYNSPEVTAEVLTEDGWLKTGDIFYRDEHWNFYFVDRFKMLLKYRNHHVPPVEIETVIKQHPGVLDVVVTGIPDKECGDLVVACVLPKSGCNPTAQEIKDLVKDSLTDTKQLRGGVIFMKEFPLTSSSKINKHKIKQMVLTLPRE